VRAVSGQKGKKFFATIKLTAARKHFVWKALQLDTAVDNLWEQQPGVNGVIHTL